MSRITHLALHVHDLEACIAFYRDFVGLHIVHDRRNDHRVVWLADRPEQPPFVIVLLPGGDSSRQRSDDYSHLGIAVDSRAAVDAVAERARRDGILAWEPREEPHPVGYFCGVRDPDGGVVEFSFGQPL